MIDYEDARREALARALEDVVDRGVVREREVDTRGAACGVGGESERASPVGLQRLGLRMRAVPDLHGLSAAPERPNEPRAEHAHAEERDHGGQSTRSGVRMDEVTVPQVPP